jgi:N utilization substance protein B
MKKKSDPRHKKRQKIVEELFAEEFTPQPTKKKDKTLKILENKSKIDRLISKSAPQWPIEKIAKIDLAILRLAIWELKIEKKEPPKAIVDEAVELAKEFGGDKSPSFVNGVLGTLLKN